MAMSFVPVRSSFITALGYNSGEQVLRVYISSRPGAPVKHYDYLGVSRFQWYRMRKHPSPGRYYGRCVKGVHARVPEPQD